MSNSSHEHSYQYSPDILGELCKCSASKFATHFGAAEYNPITKTTTRISDDKVLYKEQSNNKKG